jgi:UPF0755 protein
MKRERKQKPVRAFMLGFVLCAAVAALYLNSSPALMQGESFRVREGDSVKAAAGRLKKHNLITSEYFFRALHMAAGGLPVRKGKYRIEKGDTSVKILYMFVRGDVLTRKITIPEGFNLYLIAERLDARGVLKAGEFLYYAFSPRYCEGLGIVAPSAEGYLFPDTYVFPEESDPRDIMPVMVRRLNDVLASADLSRMKRHGLDLHGLLTLASLIEKEAGTAAERPIVSSVFHNRLRRGMKLDCDPTVRYALKKFTGRLSSRDLLHDSRHNTYLYRGLPPTPICSPGRASIEAALAPADTDFIYFVSRNDGSHYFSKTLREHLRAVEYYQKGARNGFIDTQKK